MEDRLQFLTDCHRRYGATTRLRIVSPTLLINDPEDIAHVIVNHVDNYRKNWRETGPAARRIFGHALLTKHGEAHRRHRRLVQPAFHRHAVRVFVDAIDSFLDDMLDEWEARGEVEITAELDRFAHRVLIRALLGEVDETTTLGSECGAPAFHHASPVYAFPISAASADSAELGLSAGRLQVA